MQEGNNDTEEVFRVRVFADLEICLGGNTWKHIQEAHPEVAQHLDAMEATLGDPDQIRKEAKSGRMMYIKDGAVPDGKFADKQLVVYVKVVREGPSLFRLFRRVGYVCTAHFARNAKTEKGIMSGRWRVVYQK